METCVRIFCLKLRLQVRNTSRHYESSTVFITLPRSEMTKCKISVKMGEAEDFHFNE